MTVNMAKKSLKNETPGSKFKPQTHGSSIPSKGRAVNPDVLEFHSSDEKVAGAECIGRLSQDN